ncbi:MAG TPA: hypothetical protein DCQ06_00790 [Myxococcales bacterium]|nr:hypothetical protein [Myxococcales bacterium]HAN30108.1 hypothetical protein [Myxococcales bacterium]
MSRSRSSKSRIQTSRLTGARRRRRSSASMFIESFEPLGSMIAERYRVVSHLGAGQSGAVHLVDDVKLKRKAALKVVHHDKVHKAIENEIQNLAALSHPCLLEIYDRGALPDGRHFFTSAYIRGASLEDYLFEQAVLPWSILRGVLQAVAQGLDELHAAALVHADIKPDNILLRPTADGQLAPVIIDFAFARAPGEDHGSRAGTLAYMAPEVIQGGAPSAASDIYALAIICYQCLTGINPFQASKVSTTLHLQLDLNRPEPSGLILETGAPLPTEIANLFSQSWSIEPGTRPRTAERLVGTLLSFLDPLLLAEGSRWCPQCGSTGSATDRYCSGCGCALLDTTCSQCGRSARDFQHMLCVHCGNWLATPPPHKGTLPSTHGHMPRARAVLGMSVSEQWPDTLMEQFNKLVSSAGGRPVLLLGNHVICVFERTLSGPSACLRAARVAKTMQDLAGAADVVINGVIEAAQMTNGCLSGVLGRAELPDKEIQALLAKLNNSKPNIVYVGKQARRIMGRYIDVESDKGTWSTLRNIMIKPSERTPKHRKVLQQWIEERKTNKLTNHSCVLIEGQEGSGRTTLAEATAQLWQETYGGQIIRLTVSLESPSDMDLMLYAGALVHSLDEDQELISRVNKTLDKAGWTEDILETANEMLESLLSAERPAANTRGALVPLCDALSELSDTRIVVIEAPEGVASERIEVILQSIRRRESSALIIVPEANGTYPHTLCGLAVERLTPAPLSGAEMVSWANRSLSWVEVTEEHEQLLETLSDGHARDGEHIIELLVASGVRSAAEVTKALQSWHRNRLLDERLRSLGRSERMIMTVLACLGDWVRSEDISQLAPVRFDEAAFEALLVARLVTLEPTQYGVLILIRDRRFEDKLRNRIPQHQRRQIHRSVLKQLDPNSTTRMRGQHLAAAGQLVQGANAFFDAAQNCLEVTPLASLKLMRQALDTLENEAVDTSDVQSQTLWDSIVESWATLLGEQGRAERLLDWLTPERRQLCSPEVQSLVDRLSAQGMLAVNRIDEAIEMLSQQVVTDGVTDLKTPLDLCWILIDQGRHKEALTVARMGWSDTKNERSSTNRSRSGRVSQSKSKSQRRGNSTNNQQVEAETLPVNEQSSDSAHIDTQRHAAQAMAKGLLAAKESNFDAALENLLDADDLCRVSSLWLRAVRCRILSAELWARQDNLEKATSCLKNGVSLGLRHGYIVEVERGLRGYLARHGKAPARLRRIHHTLAELLGEQPISAPPR